MKRIRLRPVIVAFASGLSLLAIPIASRADNLFVDNGSGLDQTIETINSAGVVAPFTSTGFGNPWGMAFDSAGNLYVVFQSRNIIERFNSSGGVLSSNGIAFATTAVGSSYLAFDGAGNLYVTTAGVNSTIEKYSSSGGVLSSNGTVFATGLNAPFGVAFDNAGNLYVADNGNSSVEKFNSSGGVLSSNGTVFASGLDVFAMAFDASGNLFVSTDVGANQSTIQKFNFSGGVLNSNSTVFASPGLGAMNMAFDSSGNLFVTAYHNIEEVNSSGVVTQFATVNSGAAQVYGLAFQPVPEPSVRALLAVGLVGLFSLRYRHKKSLKA